MTPDRKGAEEFHTDDYHKNGRGEASNEQRVPVKWMGKLHSSTVITNYKQK